MDEVYIQYTLTYTHIWYKAGLDDDDDDDGDGNTTAINSNNSARATRTKATPISGKSPISLLWWDNTSKARQLAKVSYAAGSCVLGSSQKLTSCNGG